MWSGACSLIVVSLALTADGFGGLVSRKLSQRRQEGALFRTVDNVLPESKGFSDVLEENKEKKEAAKLSSAQIKAELLDLLPRMTGMEEEFRTVENYVNALEEDYAPPQTLDFLNLAAAGEWQLLFSTNLQGRPRPNFRLKEMIQKVEPSSLEGTITNMAQWDLAQAGEGTIFDCSGTFSVVCEYKINQGARMLMNLKEHKLELAKGSKLPTDMQGLVGMIHRMMPTELFDPNDHAIDTTYLDVDLRIVRMTGPNFEGVRDIFIRRGSMEIKPVGED